MASADATLGPAGLIRRKSSNRRVSGQAAGRV